MFQAQPRSDTRLVRVIMIGLLVANLLATAITVWIMIEVRKEQAVFAEILKELRRSSEELKSSTQELSSELRWQYGLTIVVLLNIVATGLALAALSRAYLSSQRSLRSLKELAANILASMDHSVLTIDSQGVINGINPKGTEMLGLEAGELPKPLSELGDDLEPLRQLHAEIQERQENIRDRVFDFIFDDDSRRYRSHGHLLKDEQGTVLGTVLHVVDITEQSLLEERMRRMERYSGLGVVAAGLAHEIKNPLSALALHAQLLKERMDGGPVPDAEETIQILLSEVRRMTKVLDGFREFAAIDELDRQPVKFASLIEKVTRLLQPQLQSKGVALQLITSALGECVVDVDSVKIEQVLINLILNALEAMPNGGKLTISAAANNDTVDLSITDTGRGIPQPIRGKLFDPYFTTKDHGTGLGLAICEKIIRQHEGTIEFETSPQGTTFSLRLPCSVFGKADCRSTA